MTRAPVIAKRTAVSCAEHGRFSTPGDGRLRASPFRARLSKHHEESRTRPSILHPIDLQPARRDRLCPRPPACANDDDRTAFHGSEHRHRPTLSHSDRNSAPDPVPSADAESHVHRHPGTHADSNAYPTAADGHADFRHAIPHQLPATADAHRAPHRPGLCSRPSRRTQLRDAGRVLGRKRGVGPGAARRGSAGRRIRHHPSRRQ